MTAPMGDMPPLAQAQDAYRAATRVFAAQRETERAALATLNRAAITVDGPVLRAAFAVQTGHAAPSTLVPGSDAAWLYNLWQAYRRQWETLCLVEAALDSAEADLVAVLRTVRLPLPTEDPS